MTLGNIIGIIFVIAIILAIVGYIVTRKKKILMLAIGLVLAFIVLSILVDPAVLAAIGWFAFSALCFIVGAACLIFIRNM